MFSIQGMEMRRVVISPEPWRLPPACGRGQADVCMDNADLVNLYRLRAGDYCVVCQRSGTQIDIVRVLNKPDVQKVY